MRAGGGTSIRNGLSKGISVLRNRKHLNPITAIMLLTDGQGGDPSDDELTNMMMVAHLLSSFGQFQMSHILFCVF
jgi:Mg-chelatase subunit ChlD